MSVEGSLRVWDLLFCDGEAALLRAAAAAFKLHERTLTDVTEASRSKETGEDDGHDEARELFDLSRLLKCETSDLVAASLDPALQRATTEALSHSGHQPEQ